MSEQVTDPAFVPPATPLSTDRVLGISDPAGTPTLKVFAIADIVALAGGMQIGTASPEASVTAAVGSLYYQNDTDIDLLWIKKTGAGNTGWVEIAGQS